MLHQAWSSLSAYQILKLQKFNKVLLLSSLHDRSFNFKQLSRQEITLYKKFRDLHQHFYLFFQFAEQPWNIKVKLTIEQRTLSAFGEAKLLRASY